MKYSLPSKNITYYLPRIVTLMILVVFQFVFLTDTNAQLRPYDNGEIMVLKKGALQSDNYLSNNTFESFDQQNLSTLIRYGLAKNYELQFTWAAQKDKFLGKSVTSENASVGLKAHLTNDSKYLPALTAIVSANLTFDPKENPFNPTINLLFDKTINSTWCVNGNYLVSLNEQASDFSTNYAFNLEAAVTNWQTTYVGLTGSTNSFKSEEAPYLHYVEIGMLFWVYDGIVLYPFYDVGLNDSSGDIFNIGALFTLGK